jgi:hypothetical protein
MKEEGQTLTAEERFWSAEVRAELSGWCDEVGVGLGTQMFWAMQETKDRYQFETRGKKVLQHDVDKAHALAKRWNELMDDGDFWDAVQYERLLREAKANRWWELCELQFSPLGWY